MLGIIGVLINQYIKAKAKGKGQWFDLLHSSMGYSSPTRQRAKGKGQWFDLLHSSMGYSSPTRQKAKGKK